MSGGNNRETKTQYTDIYGVMIGFSEGEMDLDYNRWPE